MRRVIANEWITLDGVVQSPSYADEDVTGGFCHGGWHSRYFDDLSMNWVIENVRGAGGYLLGRGTYEIFAAHWPDAPQDQQVLAGPLNALPKYVASTTLEEPLGWRNSRLLGGDIGAAVRALKAQEGKDLHVIGSPGLIQTLITLGLLDELRLMIDPVLVGGGKRLFRDDGALRPLRLVGSQVTSMGAIIATYAAARPTAAAHGVGRPQVN
jgi:dihydrofolate reductase